MPQDWLPEAKNSDFNSLSKVHWFYGQRINVKAICITQNIPKCFTNSILDVSWQAYLMQKSGSHSFGHLTDIYRILLHDSSQKRLHWCLHGAHMPTGGRWPVNILIKQCMSDGENHCGEAEMEAWGEGEQAGVQGQPPEKEAADREEPCRCLGNSHNMLMDKMGTYGHTPVLLGLLQTNKDYSPEMRTDRDLREFLAPPSAALIRALHR